MLINDLERYTVCESDKNSYSAKSVTAPLEADATNRAYLARTPDVTLSGG